MAHFIDPETGMIKRMTLLARKTGIDAAEFERRWFGHHADMVKQVEGVKGYVQNKVESITGGAQPIDGIAEIWFADAATMNSVLASPQWQAVVADAREFLGDVTALSIDERTVVPVR
jgi:uncharacterized protein (TIGR02118 family)